MRVPRIFIPSPDSDSIACSLPDLNPAALLSSICRQVWINISSPACNGSALWRSNAVSVAMALTETALPQVVSRLDLTEPIVQSVLVAAAAGTRREPDLGGSLADEPPDDATESWRLGELLQLTDAVGDAEHGERAGPRLLVLQQLLLKGMLHPATELPTIRVRLTSLPDRDPTIQLTRDLARLKTYAVHESRTQIQRPLLSMSTLRAQSLTVFSDTVGCRH